MRPRWPSERSELTVRITVPESRLETSHDNLAKIQPSGNVVLELICVTGFLLLYVRLMSVTIGCARASHMQVKEL